MKRGRVVFGVLAEGRFRSATITASADAMIAEGLRKRGGPAISSNSVIKSFTRFSLGAPDNQRHRFSKLMGDRIRHFPKGLAIAAVDEDGAAARGARAIDVAPAITD